MVTWGFSLYQAFLLYNPHQKLRETLLNILDKEIVELLDNYIPGPPGSSNGVVRIVDPNAESRIPVKEFERPLHLMGVCAGLIFAHLLHSILAIWLYAASRSVCGFCIVLQYIVIVIHHTGIYFMIASIVAGEQERCSSLGNLHINFAHSRDRSCRLSISLDIISRIVPGSLNYSTHFSFLLHICCSWVQATTKKW
jgi:hypothetical protein